MQKSGGFIALLLVLAIILLPFGNSPENGYESPQIVCGDFSSQNETHEDNDTAKIIAFVIIVIIVIFIIHCITGSDNQSHERR